jgi:predicted permease
MLTVILDILLPIYAIVLLGYLLGRRKFPWANTAVTPLVFHVTLPALIIHRLANDRADSTQMLWIMLASLIILLVVLGASSALLRIRRLSSRTYLAPMMLSNMAICLALGELAFGPSGFALAIGFASVVLIFQFGVGPCFISNTFSLRPLLKQTFPWAFILALALMFGHVHLPSYVDRTLGFLGAMTIPMILLTLGFALAEIKLTNMIRPMIGAGIRLSLFVGINFCVVLLLGLEGDTKKIVLLAAVLPASTINIMMAKNCNSDDPNMTLFVFCTNIWMSAALPVAIWLVLFVN